MPSQPSSGGSDFSVGEGIGIATALLPLVSLFKGSGKSKAKAVRPVARRPIMQTAAPAVKSERTQLLLIGGGVVLVLGIGLFAMSRR